MALDRRSTIQRVYDEIHAALWAALIALVGMFPIVVAPQIMKAQTTHEAQMATEISAENDAYCRRFGLAPASAPYRSCLDDLQRFRRSVEKRVSAEYEF